MLSQCVCVPKTAWPLEPMAPYNERGGIGEGGGWSNGRQGRCAQARKYCSEMVLYLSDSGSEPGSEHTKKHDLPEKARTKRTG